MNAAVREILAIALRPGPACRRRRGSFFAFDFVFLLAPVSALIIGVLKGAAVAWQVLGEALLACAGMWAVVTWLSLSVYVQMQNVPALARLVPGHATRLRQALFIGWAVLVSTSTAIAWVLHGPAAVIFAVAAAGLATMGWMARVPGVGGPLWGIAALALGPFGIGPWIAQQDLFLVDGLAVLLGVAALYALVDDGGAAHERRHARLMASWSAARGRGQRFHTPDTTTLMARWPFRASRLYARHVDRLLAHRGAPALSRLMLALGPRGTLASASSVVLTTVLLVFGPILLTVALIGFSGVLSKIAGITFIGVSLGAVFFGAMGHQVSLRQALWATRGEQALLMLCPGVPRGAALNRGLARAFVLQAALLSLLILGALAVLVGTTSVVLVIVGFSVQPLLWTLLWVDWSRMPAPRGWGLRDALFALLLPTLALWAAIFSPLPWAWVAIACLALAVLQGVWRWRAIARAPGAWPVGRRA